MSSSGQNQDHQFPIASGDQTHNDFDWEFLEDVTWFEGSGPMDVDTEGYNPGNIEGNVHIPETDVQYQE